MLAIPVPRWAALLVFVGLALAATGCTRAPASQEVADRFMDLYYARANVAEAVKLCSGTARTRLEGELRAIQGVRPDAAGGEPRITFSLGAADSSSATQATYAYRVTAHTSDIGIVATTLGLRKENGRWSVSSFEENEGVPAP
jgi:hypothetical protein